MNYIATLALLLQIGAASVYAQSGLINMTVSGSAAPSTISLRSDAGTSEYQLAGKGTLGQFDLRVVSVSTAAPQPSSTCTGPNKLSFGVSAGAAVFRFDNGALLKGNLIAGNDCIDLSLGQALCTRVFQITGGTGRFKNASSGAITLVMTVVPLLAGATNNPVFFTVTGEINGNSPTAAVAPSSEDGQQ